MKKRVLYAIVATVGLLASAGHAAACGMYMPVRSGPSPALLLARAHKLEKAGQAADAGRIYQYVASYRRSNRVQRINANAALARLRGDAPSRGKSGAVMASTGKSGKRAQVIVASGR